MQVATTIETDTGEMIVKRVSVPIGLEELMEGLTKEVILKKPKDIYVFASQYFSHLLDLRRRGSFKGIAVKRAQSVTRQVAKEKFLNKSKSLEPPKQLVSRQESVDSESPLKKTTKSVPTKEKTKSFLDKRKARKASENTLTKSVKGLVPSDDSEKTEKKSPAKRERSISSNKKDKSEEDIKITPRQRSNSTVKSSKAGARRIAQKPEETAKKAQIQKKFTEIAQDSKTGVMVKATPIVLATKKISEAGPQLKKVEESQKNIDESPDRVKSVSDEVTRKEIHQKENDIVEANNEPQTSNKVESLQELFDPVKENLNMEQINKENIEEVEEVVKSNGDAAEISSEESVGIKKNEELKIDSKTDEGLKGIETPSDVAKESIDEKHVDLDKVDELPREVDSQASTNEVFTTEDNGNKDNNNVLREIESDTKETTSMATLSILDEKHKEDEISNKTNESRNESDASEQLTHLVNSHTQITNEANDRDSIVLETVNRNDSTADDELNVSVEEVQDDKMVSNSREEETIKKSEELPDKMSSPEPAELIRKDSNTEKVTEDNNDVGIAAGAKTLVEELSVKETKKIKEEGNVKSVDVTDVGRKEVVGSPQMSSLETTTHSAEETEETEGKNDNLKSVVNEAEMSMGKNINDKTLKVESEDGNENDVTKTCSDPKSDAEQIQDTQEFKSDEICSGCAFTEDGAVDLMSSKIKQTENKVDLSLGNNKSETNVENTEMNTDAGLVEKSVDEIAESANQNKDIEKLSLENKVDSAEKEELPNIINKHGVILENNKMKERGDTIRNNVDTKIKNEENKIMTDKTVGEAFIEDVDAKIGSNQLENQMCTSEKEEETSNVSDMDNKVSPKEIDKKTSGNKHEGKDTLDISIKISEEMEDTSLITDQKDIKKAIPFNSVKVEDVKDQNISNQEGIVNQQNIEERRTKEVEVMKDSDTEEKVGAVVEAMKSSNVAQKEAIGSSEDTEEKGTKEVEDIKNLNLPHQEINKTDEDTEEKEPKKVEDIKGQIIPHQEAEINHKETEDIKAKKIDTSKDKNLGHQEVIASHKDIDGKEAKEIDIKNQNVEHREINISDQDTEVEDIKDQIISHQEVKVNDQDTEEAKKNKIIKNQSVLDQEGIASHEDIDENEVKKVDDSKGQNVQHLEVNVNDQDTVVNENDEIIKDQNVSEQEVIASHKDIDENDVKEVKNDKDQNVQQLEVSVNDQDTEEKGVKEVESINNQNIVHSEENVGDHEVEEKSVKRVESINDQSIAHSEENVCDTEVEEKSVKGVESIKDQNIMHPEVNGGDQGAEEKSIKDQKKNDVKQVESINNQNIVHSEENVGDHEVEEKSVKRVESINDQSIAHSEENVCDHEVEEKSIKGVESIKDQNIIHPEINGGDQGAEEKSIKDQNIARPEVNNSDLEVDEKSFDEVDSKRDITEHEKSQEAITNNNLITSENNEEKNELTSQNGKMTKKLEEEPKKMNENEDSTNEKHKNDDTNLDDTKSDLEIGVIKNVNTKKEDSKDEGNLVKLVAPTLLNMAANRENIELASAKIEKNERRKSKENIKIKNSKAKSLSQDQLKPKTSPRETKDKDETKIKRVKSVESSRKSSLPRAKSKSKISSGNNKVSTNEKEAIKANDTEKSARNKRSASVDVNKNKSEKLKEPIPQSSFDSSKLREELKQVEKESKASSFKSSYNPFVLRQEIKKASQDTNEPQISQTVSTVVAALKIQALWRGFKVRRDQKLKISLEGEKLKVKQAKPVKESAEIEKKENVVKAEDKEDKLSSVAGAVVKMQALWRGFKVRKDQASRKINLRPELNQERKVIVEASDLAVTVNENNNNDLKAEASDSTVPVNENSNKDSKVEPSDSTVTINEDSNKDLKTELSDSTVTVNENSNKDSKVEPSDSPVTINEDSNKDLKTELSDSTVTVNENSNKDSKVEPSDSPVTINEDSNKDLKTELSDSTVTVNENNNKDLKVEPSDSAITVNKDLKVELSDSTGTLNEDSDKDLEVEPSDSVVTVIKESNKDLKMADAVLKIQAIWRGFHVRQRKKRGILFGKTIEKESNAPEALRSVEKACKAVTSAMKIQALWRGYKVRKNIKDVNDKLAELQKPSECDEMPNQRGPTDEDIMRAATKIQAGVRGYMVRRKVNKNHLQAISEETSRTKLSDDQIVEAITKLDEVPQHSPQKEKFVKEPELVRQLAKALSMDVSKSAPEKLKNNSLDDGTGDGDEELIINDMVRKLDEIKENPLDLMEETGEKKEKNIITTPTINEEHNEDTLDTGNLIAANTVNKLSSSSELSGLVSVSNETVSKNENPSTNSEDSYETAPTRPVTSDIIVEHINNRNVASKMESYNENKQTEQSKNVGFNDEHSKNVDGNKNNPVAATEKLLNEINNQITQIANEENKEKDEEKSRPTSLESTASTDSVVTVIENVIEKTTAMENKEGIDEKLKKKIAANLDEEQIIKEEICKIEQSATKFDLSKLRVELEEVAKFKQDSDSGEMIMGTNNAVRKNDEQNKDAFVEDKEIKELKLPDVQIEKEVVQNDGEVEKQISDTNSEDVTRNIGDGTNKIIIDKNEVKEVEELKKEVTDLHKENVEKGEEKLDSKKDKDSGAILREINDSSKSTTLIDTREERIPEGEEKIDKENQCIKEPNMVNFDSQETEEKKDEATHKVQNKTTTTTEDDGKVFLVNDEQKDAKFKIESLKAITKDNAVESMGKSSLAEELNGKTKMTETKGDLKNAEMRIGDGSKEEKLNESALVLASNPFVAGQNVKAQPDFESKTLTNVETPIAKEKLLELKEESESTKKMVEGGQENSDEKEKYSDSVLKETKIVAIDKGTGKESTINEATGAVIAENVAMTPVMAENVMDLNKKLQSMQELRNCEEMSENIDIAKKSMGGDKDSKNIEKLEESDTVVTDEDIGKLANSHASKTEEIEEKLKHNTILESNLDKKSNEIREEKLESEDSFRKFPDDEDAVPKSNSPNNKLNVPLLQEEIDQKVKPLESTNYIEETAPTKTLAVSDLREDAKLLSEVDNNKVNMQKLEQEINSHMSQDERNSAATKIQSTYRGYRVRRNIKYAPRLEVPSRELSDIKEEEIEGKFSLDSLDNSVDESVIATKKNLELNCNEDRRRDEEISAILLAANSDSKSENLGGESLKNRDSIKEDKIVATTGEESGSHKVDTPKPVIEGNDDVVLKTSSPVVVAGDRVNGQNVGTTTINLIHSGEFHDTITLPLSVSPPRTEESEGGLVNTGEFHDSVMPVSVQLNQAPPAGAEVLTSFEPDSSDAGQQDFRPAGAQASDKDASTCVAQPDNVSPPSVSGMETEKRNNNAAAHSPKKNMEAEAATKIQAGFRGYQVRKQMKSKIGAPGDISNQRRSSRRKSSGRVGDSGRVSQTKPKTPDLEEKSAVKIQAGIRGFLVRRRQKKQIKAKESAAA